MPVPAGAVFTADGKSYVFAAIKTTGASSGA
jgi:hypothetical protein